MALAFRPLHPRFAAEVDPIDLRRVEDRATLEDIRAGMDRHAVLVFRDQQLEGGEQLAFAERFDGNRAQDNAVLERVASATKRAHLQRG
jgi:alpha-ketoglutarate-dependent 2,4-dichlorophenoxyacetate dioxygenase